MKVAAAWRLARPPRLLAITLDHGAQAGQRPIRASPDRKAFGELSHLFSARFSPQ
jgi:hypothetical protein